MAGLAVHQDLAALGAPSLDERHSTLVVFEFRFLVVLSTIAGVTHAKKRHLKKKTGYEGKFGQTTRKTVTAVHLGAQQYNSLIPQRFLRLHDPGGLVRTKKNTALPRCVLPGVERIRPNMS